MDGQTAREVLGIPADTVADHTTITRAYRCRAKQTHPDRGGDRREFTRLGEAVATLRAQADEGARCRSTARFRSSEPRPTSTWSRHDSLPRPVRTTRAEGPTFAEVLARAMAA